MAKRIGKCTNYSGCKLAYRNEQIDVVTKEFRCPECGSPLEPVGQKRDSSLTTVFIVGVAAVLLLAIIAIAWVMMSSSHGGRIVAASTPSATPSPTPTPIQTPTPTPTETPTPSPEASGTPINFDLTGEGLEQVKSATPTASTIPSVTISPAVKSSDTLPPFFPPKATSTADLSLQLKEIYNSYRRTQGRGPSMKQLDGALTKVLEEAGYDRISHYWLAGSDNPGFAVATRIEFIDHLGRPVMDHRFETALPTPNWFRGWDFLKALVLPRNGRYRLFAFVIAQKGLVEKPTEMTSAQVDEINHGPNALSDRDWADLEVTPKYNFTAYIYEFYRKTRSEPISVLSDRDSNIRASQHLASIGFDEKMKRFSP